MRNEPTTLGGAISIPANGLRLLDRLGVYARIREGGSITDDMVLHATDGSELGRVDLVSDTQARIGYGFMRVKRTVVMDALFTAVEEAGIPVRFGRRIVGIHEDEDEETVTATFEDGAGETADLLVGCDGIHSAVRSLHVNPGLTPEYSGVASMSSIIRMRTDLSGMNITFTSQGSIVVLPCTEPKTDTDTGEKEFFWFLTRHIPPPTDAASSRDGWSAHGAKEVAGFKTTVQEIIHDIDGAWGSTMREVVANTESVNFYPVYRLRRDDGGSWHTRRCVLLGDAAHAMPPHVGQGVSMALEDVFLLSRVLGPQAWSLEDGLRRFERIRRPRVQYMAERAADNGKRSRPKASWQMVAMEWYLWAWSWACRWLPLSSWSWRLSEGDLVYDIDEVDIENV